MADPDSESFGDEPNKPLVDFYSIGDGVMGIPNAHQDDAMTGFVAHDPRPPQSNPETTWLISVYPTQSEPFMNHADIGPGHFTAAVEANPGFTQSTSFYDISTSYPAASLENNGPGYFPPFDANTGYTQPTLSYGNITGSPAASSGNIDPGYFNPAVANTGYPQSTPFYDNIPDNTAASMESAAGLLNSPPPVAPDFPAAVETNTGNTELMEAPHDITDYAATSEPNTARSRESLSPVTPNSGPGQVAEAARPLIAEEEQASTPKKGNKWPNLKSCDRCVLLGYGSCDWSASNPLYSCYSCKASARFSCSYVMYEQNKDDPNEEIPPLPQRRAKTGQTKCDKCSLARRFCDWIYEWPKSCSPCRKWGDSCTLRKWKGEE